jgi:antiviral helicase SLH1
VTPGHATKEILSLKRANWPNMEQRGGRGAFVSNVKMRLEDAEHERKVDVLVMSDAYPGMEWGVQGVVVPKSEVETVVVEVDEGLDKKGKAKVKGGVGGEGSSGS